jgi:hypothetical protein
MSLYRVVLNINFRNSGCTEIYFTGVSDAPGALAIAKKIALYRTAFFGAEVELVYAHASSTNSTKDAVTCDLDFPLGPHKAVPTGVLAPNDSSSAVQQRFETAAGQWSNRMFRFCPDNYLEGAVIADKNIWRPLDPGNAPVNPEGSGTLVNIQKSFWSYLILNSPHTRKTGPDTFVQTPIVRILPIRVSRRATGRPFGLFRGRRSSNLVV